MTSPPVVGKRRSLTQLPTTEDQQLNLISQEAESRLANSHAVLAEARKIRTHERQLLQEVEPGEEDLNGEDAGVPPTSKPIPVAAHTSSGPAVKRLISDDVFVPSAQFKVRPSAPQGPTTADLEDKYKRVMMTNAQLDNEKQMLSYQVDLLKEQLDDAEEQYLQLEHQHSNSRRELTESKRTVDELMTKCNSLKEQLFQRDSLIKEHGLMFVSVGEPEGTTSQSLLSSALLSVECAQLLNHYDGSLGERLQKFFQDKLTLEEENKRLQHELEMEVSRAALSHKFPLSDATGVSTNSPSISMSNDSPLLDVETQKNVTEYKLKLKRAEHEITTLQGTVTRLDSQVNRYKTAAETSEKAEEELKQEKRRLQKELREAQALVQDLETKNGHLIKRLEKTKLRNMAEAS